jgi:hypothetical protein
VAQIGAALGRSFHSSAAHCHAAEMRFREDLERLFGLLATRAIRPRVARSP